MNARSAFMRATARLVAVALLASGCSKSLPTLEDLPPSSPNGADANAGAAALPKGQRDWLHRSASP